MNVHKNARLTPRGRRIVWQVASGQTPEAVAQAAGVCPRTVRKWVDRYRRAGLAGLQDRSSRPHRLRRPTPQAVVMQIERLRRQRWTGKQIASETGVSPATVSRSTSAGIEQAQCLAIFLRLAPHRRRAVGVTPRFAIMLRAPGRNRP
jgi:transposase